MVSMLNEMTDAGLKRPLQDADVVHEARAERNAHAAEVAEPVAKLRLHRRPLGAKWAK